MAEELIVVEGAKEEKYDSLYNQIRSVISGESDSVANMANIAAMIHHTFGFWWTGFYRVIGNELVLGPFQGPMACTRIPYGRGVSGTSFARKETVIVPDVDKFPGHIACSSASRSEIVVPVSDTDGNVVAVLDIDSAELDTFDRIDGAWLEKIVALLTD